MSLKNIQISLKYAIDRALGLVGFILILPVLLVISLVVYLDDPGPVIFLQERVGLDRKPFKIWKFRSMIIDADRLLDATGGVGGQQRVTRVGRILRATSLDELPQIINIMLGQMSFVGPRPTLPESYERYSDDQKRRCHMKPGVTGLAQVNGRNLLKWSKRLAYDLEYVDRYSLWLDLKILLKTIKVVVFREGIVMDRNPEQVDDLPN